MSKYPIVDSHIHLYPESHIKTLGWTGDLPKTHPLNRQLSVAEYKKAAATASGLLKGFVFIETDRISKALPDSWTDASASNADYPEPAEWKHALDEISFVARIATGQPLENEGHDPSDRDLLLGFVPWAPVTAGSSVLSKYHTFALGRCSKMSASIVPRLRGYRYLFQDKPPNTMLDPLVLDSLRFLGKSNLTFDLGVDARQGGFRQLQEANTLLSRLLAADEESSTSVSTPLPKIIINHLCKPNLRLSAQDSLSGHPDFVTWKQLITTMSEYPYTYMKLSGGWSELPPQQQHTSPSSSSSSSSSSDNDIILESLLTQIQPWTDVVFDTFGPRRVMFGSDWPVCNVGGPGAELSWSRWRDLVERVLERRGYGEEEKAWVWAGTAREAYGFKV